MDTKETDRTDRLPEKVRLYMEKEKMARQGSRILAGVSGGADSVCLLALLVRLREEYGWQIAAVHVNHRIREEAEEDAAYVRGLCKEWNVPFFLKEEDVKKKAGEWHMSLEEAGRKVRYQAFAEAAEQFGADRVAVAHNRSDRAETLLFHLFRGTGLKGMGSIRPVRGSIIRPLLDTGREEIEEWLKKNGISWRTDATNESDDYTRNRIRRRVIPYVEEEICGEAGLHLARAAGLLAQVSDYMDGQARARLQDCLVFYENDVAGLDVQAFLASDELLQTLMLQVAHGGAFERRKGHRTAPYPGCAGAFHKAERPHADAAGRAGGQTGVRTGHYKQKGGRCRRTARRTWGENARRMRRRNGNRSSEGGPRNRKRRAGNPRHGNAGNHPSEPGKISGN